MEAILTISLVYGITFSLRDATILNRPRNWVMSKSLFLTDLLSCPFCTGFHSGWLSFLILYWGGLAHSMPFVPSLVVYAFSGASISYIIDVAMQRLERD